MFLSSDIETQRRARSCTAERKQPCPVGRISYTNITQAPGTSGAPDRPF
jgi:hypothetical protein